MHDRFTRRPSLNMLYFSFLAISGWCVTVTEHTKVRGDGKTAKFRTRCMINEGRLHARCRYQLYCHFLWRLPEWEQKSVRPISGMPGFLESRLGSLLGVGRMHATLANRGRLGVHLCRRGRIYFLGVRHVSSCWSMNSRWKTCDGWFHVPHGSPSPVGSRHVLGKSWLMGGKRHITKLGENVGGEKKKKRYRNVRWKAFLHKNAIFRRIYIAANEAWSINRAFVQKQHTNTDKHFFFNLNIGHNTNRSAFKDGLLASKTH